MALFFKFEFGKFFAGLMQRRLKLLQVKWLIINAFPLINIDDPKSRQLDPKIRAQNRKVTQIDGLLTLPHFFKFHLQLYMLLRVKRENFLHVKMLHFFFRQFLSVDCPDFPLVDVGDDFLVAGVLSIVSRMIRARSNRHRNLTLSITELGLCNL